MLCGDKTEPQLLQEEEWREELEEIEEGLTCTFLGTLEGRSDVPGPPLAGSESQPSSGIKRRTLSW